MKFVCYCKSNLLMMIFFMRLQLRMYIQCLHETKKGREHRHSSFRIQTWPLHFHKNPHPLYASRTHILALQYSIIRMFLNLPKKIITFNYRRAPIYIRNDATCISNHFLLPWNKCIKIVSSVAQWRIQKYSIRKHENEGHRHG